MACIILILPPITATPPERVTSLEYLLSIASVLVDASAKGPVNVLIGFQELKPDRVRLGRHRSKALKEEFREYWLKQGAIAQ